MIKDSTKDKARELKLAYYRINDIHELARKYHTTTARIRGRIKYYKQMGIW